MQMNAQLVNVIDDIVGGAGHKPQRSIVANAGGTQALNAVKSASIN